MARVKADRPLIKVLQTGHRLADEIAVSGAAPTCAYDRLVCLTAYLEPDMQRAILEGRQPPGFNLETLVHGAIPLSWAQLLHELRRRGISPCRDIRKERTSIGVGF